MTTKSEHVTDENRSLSFFDVCAWCVISVSLVGQVIRYFQNRGLRYDECRVALNLVERDFLGLTRPLNYEQAAPIGFLWIEKLAILLMGDNEYSLRFFPLLAGLATPVVLWFAVRRAGTARVAAIATFILSLNSHVLLYTGELKQYAGDIATCVLLLALGDWALRSPLTSSRLIAISFVGAVSLWFSHPAVFVIGGLWAAVAGRALFPLWSPETDIPLSRRVAIESLIIGTGILGLSFPANYRIAIAPLLGQGWTTDCWRDNFAPFPPMSARDLDWYVHAFADMLLTDRTGGLAGLSMAGPYFLGVVVLFRKQPWLVVMLVIPSLLALGASALGRFGFADRQILFLQPFVVYLAAYGIDEIVGLATNRIPRLSLLAISTAAAYCVIVPTIALCRGSLNHWNRLETMPVLSDLSARLADGDVVYVTQSLWYPFLYYSRFHQSPDGITLSQWPGLYAPSADARIAHEGTNTAGYELELDDALIKKPKARRVWVVTARMTWVDGGDVRSSIRKVLEKRGKVNQFDADGVSAFLLTLPEESRSNISD